MSQDRTNVIIMGIMLVLNFIDGNPPTPVGDLYMNLHPPDPFVERCRAALANFRVYIHGAACTIIGHALLVVWSLYPAVDLKVIGGRFVEGMEDDVADKLANEATESAFKLVKDLDIFDDKEQ